MAYYDDVKDAADYIRARISKVPDLAIVLGSGLGDFAGTLGDAVSMPYCLNIARRLPALSGAKRKSMSSLSRTLSGCSLRGR